MANPLANALRTPNYGTPSNDIMRQQLELQQRQQMAQALYNTPQQQPQGQIVGGHYVRPNIGQALGGALQQLAGYQAMQELPERQIALQQAQQQQLAGQFGLGGGQPQQQQMPMQEGEQVAQAMPIQQQQPSIPLLPGRDAQQSYQIAQQIGIPEYLKLVATQGAPTDTQRDLAASGYAPGSADFQAALRANTLKPINASPGATLLDPVTGRPTFSAPQDGMQTRYDAQGNASVSQVPGYGEAQAANAGMQAGAQEQARAQFDIVEVPDGNGGTVRLPRAEAAAALSQGGASSKFGKTPSPLTKDANRTIDLIGEAREILPKGSSGALSNLQTRGGEFFGKSSDASKADAQLRIISGQLVSMMPKMSGPQSDKDVELYKQMAGDIANPSLPVATRMAALETIETINKKYATPSASAPGGVARIDSQQQYQSLPSGSLFVAPDGTTRRKP